MQKAWWSPPFTYLKSYKFCCWVLPFCAFFKVLKVLSYLVRLMVMCIPVFSFSYLKIGTICPATLRIKREGGLMPVLQISRNCFVFFNVTNVYYRDIFFTSYFHFIHLYACMIASCNLWVIKEHHQVWEPWEPLMSCVQSQSEMSFVRC